MAVTVSLTGVKDKCGITTSTYDTKINSLIAEWVPALEFAIHPSNLTNTEPGLVATLNLGATEMVAGEFLAQLAREPGGSEDLYFGWVEIHSNIRDMSDPSGLKTQGNLRLKPFLKHVDLFIGSLGVVVGGDREKIEG